MTDGSPYARVLPTQRSNMRKPTTKDPQNEYPHHTGNK